MPEILRGSVFSFNTESSAFDLLEYSNLLHRCFLGRFEHEGCRCTQSCRAWGCSSRAPRSGTNCRSTPRPLVQHSAGRWRYSGTLSSDTTRSQLTILQADSVFSGIATFGRIQYHPCLSSHDVQYDIAFIGSLHPTPSSLFPVDLTSGRRSV